MRKYEDKYLSTLHKSVYSIIAMVIIRRIPSLIANEPHPIFVCLTFPSTSLSFLVLTVPKKMKEIVLITKMSLLIDQKSVRKLIDQHLIRDSRYFLENSTRLFPSTLESSVEEEEAKGICKRLTMFHFPGKTYLRRWKRKGREEEEEENKHG